MWKQCLWWKEPSSGRGRGEWKHNTRRYWAESRNPSRGVWAFDLFRSLFSSLFWPKLNQNSKVAFLDTVKWTLKGDSLACGALDKYRKPITIRFFYVSSGSPFIFSDCWQTRFSISTWVLTEKAKLWSWSSLLFSDYFTASKHCQSIVALSTHRTTVDTHMNQCCV